MLEVQDDFFPNPHVIRNIAIDTLMREHDCILNDATNNYPGIRSRCSGRINDYIIEYVEKKFKKSVNKSTFFSSFHITSKIHNCGLIHQDFESFAGLVYLNENPPQNSGTILCKKNQFIDEPKRGDRFNKASTTKNFEIIENFGKYKEEYNKNFEIEFEIENKFNRFLLYEGSHYHAPYYYFGNNFFNSRLVLVFWFNLE